MLELNTILLVCGIVAPLTVIATVAFFMLLGCYLGVKDVGRHIGVVKKEEDEEEGGVITIPLSQLANMGGGRPITQADVDRARAAMAQHAAGGAPAPGAPGAPEEKREAYVPGGYL